ncbi:PqiC family protein [Teichococcus oryzae]|uniref:Membrane integrity-associated transporter subunit PqiC n=1 Tax=Teichococcus oryzae TaxID=1608942 RepID=A0A5B2TE56_9PROT|nr:PqiC family protein [Pseudoroseomonas oryzae]KAA2212384.1 membrane integrity-associated transporter subunit PqiC [Pseudoroseomonas oryzae]
MIRRRALLALPVPLAALLAGCASAEPDYFRLSATPGPARRSRHRLVELRSIGLPRYLDRAEILRASGPNRLDLLSGDRWAEPMADMVGRVLGEDLQRRLPNSTVFSAGGALSIDSDAVAEVEILRFEQEGDGPVLLMAQLAVRPASRGRRAARNVRLQAPVEGTATAALVAAMSQALGQLADALAEMLAAA